MGTALLEPPGAEQDVMIDVVQATRVDHLIDLVEHRGAFAAMDHAKQVIGPFRQAARALVTQGDELKTAQTFAQFINAVVGMAL